MRVRMAQSQAVLWPVAMWIEDAVSVAVSVPGIVQYSVPGIVQYQSSYSTAQCKRFKPQHGIVYSLVYDQ